MCQRPTTTGTVHWLFLVSWCWCISSLFRFNEIQAHVCTPRRMTPTLPWHAQRLWVCTLVSVLKLTKNVQRYKRKHDQQNDGRMCSLQLRVHPSAHTAHPTEISSDVESVWFFVASRLNDMRLQLLWLVSYAARTKKKLMGCKDEDFPLFFTTPLYQEVSTQ